MSSRPETWISIAATERPASLRLLAGDLVELAKEARHDLRVFVIDNGKTEAARRATEDALAALISERIPLILENASKPGGSIACSRRDQRDQVRRALATSTPTLIWMLDDDLRLEHQVVDSGALKKTRLHNHLGFLVDVKHQHPEVHVLLGEVNGDPPIPAVATFASRLEDLVSSLRRMGEMPPDAAWEGEFASPPGSPSDDYYDFAEGGFAAPRLWSAQRPGITVAHALEEMLAEACDIPFGIAFSRPILANAGEFSRLRDATIRGGHAAFFSPEAFLAQRYASLTFAGIETRRSDTIASTLYSRANLGRLRKSTFSVLHARPRHGCELPNGEQLARHLIADTWGAALTRAIEDQGHSVAQFLKDRLARIDRALTRIALALDHTTRFAVTAPAWAKRPTASWQRLEERMRWMLDTVPGVREGRLAAPWRELLCSNEAGDALGAFARRLTEDHDAE